VKTCLRPLLNSPCQQARSQERQERLRAALLLPGRIKNRSEYEGPEMPLCAYSTKTYCYE